MAKTEGVDRLTKQEVLSQINTWTKKHYMDILREIQEILNESLPIKEVKFEDTPDDEMCF